MTGLKRFSDFRVGDCVVVDRSFSIDDFEDFAKLSGDRNPFHWNEDYARLTESGKPIVPMHLTMAPLSMLAGMVFPGEPSLYLGHDVRSIMPVFYGDRLRYSARLVSINESHRILTLRVLVLRGSDVLLDANMRVQARSAEWQASEKNPGNRLNPRRALITGASGEIGSALAMTLAQRGWSLLLHDRGDSEKRKTLQQKISSLLKEGQSIEFCAANLLDDGGIAALAAKISELDDIALLLHVASPPTNAVVEDLVKVNYTALKRLTEASLPAMLARQEGKIVSLGSIATERVIPGWDDYAAAKAMAGQYVTAVDKARHEFGVKGLTVLAGMVATSYSQAFRGDNPALLPQELAETVVNAVADEAAHGALVVEWSGKRSGLLGFHQKRSGDPAASVAAPGPVAESGPSDIPVLKNSDGRASVIKELVRARLRLPDGAALENGGLGITPGWDSLRHLELLLEIEQKLGVRFSSDDMGKTLNFEDLLAISLKRLEQQSTLVKEGRS
ncbi:SDR family NAD(P)-dependent oxidoreductase [Pseudomonas sp. R2.Fl]|nr:SDR family NAD(P)-dependent oxidoreductase [Pseudomonas sp. R2.Fl]